MPRIAVLGILFLSFIGQSAARPQSPLPELPADIPKDASVRMLLTDQAPSGQDAVWQTSDGVIHEFFQFNDRGRGPKIYTTYRLDADGLILTEASEGVDYMKNAVQERFSLVDGKATWKNQAEESQQAGASGKFYIDLNGGPESGAILARALLKAKSSPTLPVLPGGTARIRKLQSLAVEAKGKKQTATLYEIAGLAYTPNYLWLDDQQQFFAFVSGWFSVVRQGFEPSFPILRESQRQVEDARAAELARKLTSRPKGDLVIRNVRLFDSETGKVLPNQRVTVRGQKIASVEPDQDQPVTGTADTIDGKGKMLLPGLWDMHAHLFPDNAFLDIASGVTTVRDLGNSIEELTKLRQQIDRGTQIGPRVVPAGFIDGPGPFEGPVKVLAATPEEARERVDRYADLGYVQIKIYSSLKPELVPVIIVEAHKRGLRVSGHVPANMIAEQFIRDGADEIQHMNFIFLNFMPDVKETRTPARFIEPGKRGAQLDLNSEQVTGFIALLKQRRTVVDPTIGVWESSYLSRPGQVPKLDAPIFDRLPVQVQRGIKSGGDALPVSDPETDRQYRASYAKMVSMLKKLYDSGVEIVAGTDAGSGYAFHRELEIYNEAGIPAAEVLRIATIEAARVMHREQEFGSIRAGKYADMILVNGDPTKQIGDIRRIDVVIKNGEIYKPSEMYPAFGIRAD
jgi:imidazolonepropionase-like amidohydrolase